jgi:hypothetical protein
MATTAPNWNPDSILRDSIDGLGLYIIDKRQSQAGLPELPLIANLMEAFYCPSSVAVSTSISVFLLQANVNTAVQPS